MKNYQFLLLVLLTFLLTFLSKELLNTDGLVANSLAEQLTSKQLNEVLDFNENQNAEASIRTLELALVQHKFKKYDEYVDKNNSNQKVITYSKNTFVEKVLLGTGTQIVAVIVHTKGNNNLILNVSYAGNIKQSKGREKLQTLISEIKEAYSKM